MKKIALFTLMACIIIPIFSMGQSVVSSKHNLSVSGPGTVKADTESQICIFCHTPHSSAPLMPLWNKNDPGNTYTLYSSSTLQAAPGQPDGSAILCLSCHDGTIALGNVVSRTTDITFAGGITTMPTGRYNLTTDLSDDHPVSFTYSVAASGDNQIKAAPVMPAQLENGKVQCISCHDPHNDINGKFLVETKQYSALCFKCHDRDFWTSSTHNSSTASWSGAGTDPWAHIEVPYSTVAENSCESCHNPHNANGNLRLLKSAAEEYNCLDCHNGNVAATDIETQSLKIYNHNVFGYANIHDPTEAAMIATIHVECQDCHNPHAVNATTANAPNANGFIAGVKGIDTGGNAVTTINFEYELCYRCHADAAVTNSPVTRQIAQNNVRLEFDLSNPSHHAIEGPGVSSDVPSLIPPLTTSSIIYCTDCHASDGVGSPAGPHGSIYPQILKYQYETADNTPENAQNYELCYSCHSRTSILNDVTFSKHKKHITDDIPCNACHDPHGISSSQGNTTNNSRLINFDLNIVFPNQDGDLWFEDRGDRRGRCYLECHGKDHAPKGYN